MVRFHSRPVHTEDEVIGPKPLVVLFYLLDNFFHATHHEPVTGQLLEGDAEVLLSRQNPVLPPVGVGPVLAFHVGPCHPDGLFMGAGHVQLLDDG